MNDSNNIQPAETLPKSKMDPRVRNTIIYCVVTGSIIVFGIIGIVLLLAFGRTRKNTPPIVEKMPTLELAQSVCEKYGGEFETEENDSENLIVDSYVFCKTDDFSYNLGFFGEDVTNEYRSEIMRKMIVYPDEYEHTIVLDNSDNIVKLYDDSSEDIIYMIIYNSVMLELEVYDKDFNAEDLLVELGFPDRNRIEDYNSSSPNTLINTNYPSEPSIEAAKDVCERYDGKFVNVDEARFGHEIEILAAGDFWDIGLPVLDNNKICERYSKNGNGDMPPPNDIVTYSTDFAYEIGFMGDISKYRNMLEEIFIKFEGHEDTSKYIILENSDNLLKACNSTAMTLTCTAIYNNAFVTIRSSSFRIIDQLFAELGFPNRATLKEYADSKKAESNN